MNSFPCHCREIKKLLDKKWKSDKLQLLNVGGFLTDMQVLPKELVVIVQDNLFQKYLTFTDDVQKCPRPGCNYAGFLPNSTFCRSKLECLLCKTKWKNTRIPKLIDEIKINTWELIFTKICPKCKMHIQKNGGCPPSLAIMISVGIAYNHIKVLIIILDVLWNNSR